MESNYLLRTSVDRPASKVAFAAAFVLLTRQHVLSRQLDDQPHILNRRFYVRGSVCHTDGAKSINHVRTTAAEDVPIQTELRQTLSRLPSPYC